MVALAHLLGRKPLPLNPANGREEVPTVAFIDEDVCIGCTKCVQACPVDAIVGAAKRMHTIIAAEWTTATSTAMPRSALIRAPGASWPLSRPAARQSPR